MSTSPPPPDRPGPYRPVGRIGAGGMAVVYVALESEGRRIGLKTVHAKHADRLPGTGSRWRPHPGRP